MSAFTTLARAFKGGSGPRQARASLLPLRSGDDEPQPGLQRSFQYFPETITDSHASNYQTKIIPGLSHPLYQWTSGGARTIGFEAFFTRDRTYSKDEADTIKSQGAKSTPSGGSVISRLGQAVSGAGVIQQLGVSRNDDPRNVDIPSAVAWLRSFMLPEYPVVNGQVLRPRPPRKMILSMPGVRLNWGIPQLPAEDVYVIMTGCDVTYTGFFHDGSPRLAKVALAFAEIIQVNGKVTVHQAADRRRLGFGGYGLNAGKDK